MVFVSIPALANAQTDQPPTGPPLSQALVREGDFALSLADSLRLGTANETEAESALSAIGIAPRNGWIADYPVTPDIIGELQSALSDAADSGRLAMGKDEALAAFQNVIDQYDLNVRMDTSGRDVGDTSGTEYPDASVMNDYYYDEGPPVVTYYAPPPDYAYLYTWVPYPFWWWSYWFPGFFVLVDFDVKADHHGHGDGHDHGHHEHHGGEGSVSNHYRDPGTGNMVRVDPTNRFRGGTFSGRAGSRWQSPSARSGAKAIVSPRRVPSGGVSTGTTGRNYRGYGVSRSAVGTRSSAFDRSVNSRVERSSSSRGYQSRSSAGQVRGTAPASRGGAPAPSRGAGSTRGATRGFHGGGRR